MDIAINLLGKIIGAYDAENFEEMNYQNSLFDDSLREIYGEDQTNSERRELDNIRQTFVMSTTGFPVKDEDIKKARYKYEIMNAYLEK